MARRSPIPTIREFGNQIASERAKRDLNPRRLFQLATEGNDLLMALPHRLDLISARLAAGEFETRIDVPQLAVVMTGMQKVANRIFSGLVVAAIIVMPILSIFALMLGTAGAIIISSLQFGITTQFFIRSSLETIQMSDLVSGLAKPPVFGFIISIVGCHFGRKTKGGTEGVGLSTTRTVVVVSIAILVADFIMTKLFIMFGAT